MSTSRVLVIAAHPDDEVLGCGGTMARLVDEGDEVHVAILGEGLTSRDGSQSRRNEKSFRALRAQARRAGRCLRVRDVVCFGLPDNRFDTLPLLEIVKLVEGVLGRLDFDSVYTHHGGDLNIDHQLVSRAVLTACRPLGSHSVKHIYAFEIPSSTEWAFGQLEPTFRPSVFVDISRTLNAKLRAMEFYTSETRPFPHPRSAGALRAVAQRWGTVAGLEAAEAFELIRSVR